MKKKKTSDADEILLYKEKGGQTAVEVRFQGETAWLALNQIADLFQRDKSVISRHLRNIFETGELMKSRVVAKNATTAADGKIYQVEYYNLDAIISVGYRVNSKRGTQFRIWAARVIKDHLIKGYSLNQKRLRERQTSSFKELESAIELVRSVSGGKSLTKKRLQFSAQSATSADRTVWRSWTNSNPPTIRGYDYRDDLKALEAMWLEKLKPFGERGYH